MQRSTQKPNDERRIAKIIEANADGTRPTQPHCFMFVDESSLVQVTAAGKQDVPCANAVFRESLGRLFSDPSQTVVPQPIRCEVGWHHDWKTFIDVLVRMQLAAEWPNLDSAIRDQLAKRGWRALTAHLVHNCPLERPNRFDGVRKRVDVVLEPFHRC